LNWASAFAGAFFFAVIARKLLSNRGIITLSGDASVRSLGGQLQLGGVRTERF
jgi:hypothetical protein